MQLSIRKLAGALALGAASLGASSAAYADVTYDGVTFTTSWSGNELTVEIDAAGRTGGWADALTIGSLEVKGIGTFDSVSLAGPGDASSWTIVANELNANGCVGGAQGGRNACAFGSHIGLTDDMIFKFTFGGDNLDLTNPHLKVAFYGDGDRKVGSLLSVDVPTSPVPEPGEYAMLLAGLGVLGMVAHRKRKSVGLSAA